MLKPSLNFQNLGTLQVSQLNTETLNTATEQAQCSKEVRMAVTLYNLGGNGVYTDTEQFAGNALHLRIKQGIGPTAPEILPTLTLFNASAMRSR